MTRVISGVVLAVAALAAIVWLPFLPLRILACTVAALATHEYLTIVGNDRRASRWVVVVAAVLACWLSSVPSFVDARLILLGAVAWVAIGILYEDRTAQDAAADLVAPAYVGMPLGLLVNLHGSGGWPATLVLIGTIVVSDSGQYYSGRMFGRRPLAPGISPKKTVEGAIGGAVLGILFMAIAGRWALPGAGLIWLVVAGLIVVVFGIIGDLFESRLKRVAGLKDSSALIPGHGGVLDRIDALLFAVPAFYLMVTPVS